MGNFWDTLEAYGKTAAETVVAPIGRGVSAGFEHLVQAGVQKVSSVSDTIARTTDPNKPTASQPAAPPTTTKTPAQIAQAAAQTQASFGILAVVAVVVLVLYMRGKN